MVISRQQWKKTILLGSLRKQRLVKTQQTRKIYHVLWWIVKCVEPWNCLSCLQLRVATVQQIQLPIQTPWLVTKTVKATNRRCLYPIWKCLECYGVMFGIYYLRIWKIKEIWIWKLVCRNESPLVYHFIQKYASINYSQCNTKNLTVKCRPQTFIRTSI
jgi:hypothetical protein